MMYAIINQRTARVCDIDRNSAQVAKVKSRTKQLRLIVLSVLHAAIKRNAPWSAPLRGCLTERFFILLSIARTKLRYGRSILYRPFTLQQRNGGVRYRIRANATIRFLYFHLQVTA